MAAKTSIKPYKLQPSSDTLTRDDLATWKEVLLSYMRQNDAWKIFLPGGSNDYATWKAEDSGEARVKITIVSHSMTSSQLIVEPKEDKFVSKMSGKAAALAPHATYKPVKEVEYPQVDLNHLNSHFIKNIPKPYLLPILGCSDDPKFYARVDHRQGIQNFYKEFPFGSKFGYRTNLGIVAVPDRPIHGYVWSGGEWMVYASLPSSTLPDFKVRKGRAGG